MPLSFFQGQVVKEFNSPFSGKIQLIKHLGSYKIVAGDLLQSGSIVKNLWQKPLKKVKSKNEKVKSILLLGLGGGTIIPLLTKKWPQAQITAIEIDQIMIKLARQYFGLNRYSQVKPIEADAFTFVKNLKEQYDLVIVDLFCGNSISATLYSPKFIRDLKKVIKSTGFLLINHLFFGEYQIAAEKLITTTDKEFETVNLIRNLSNIFLLCS
ncbi:methyltransferase domain-containing protein [Candidatus Beckwithbacteria bacterium]|nr:methyltransferase domain-containing protein [Candidatus Beckwithbacteria bacterium]